MDERGNSKRDNQLYTAEAKKSTHDEIRAVLAAIRAEASLPAFIEAEPEAADRITRGKLTMADILALYRVEMDYRKTPPNPITDDDFSEVLALRAHAFASVLTSPPPAEVFQPSDLEQAAREIDKAIRIEAGDVDALEDHIRLMAMANHITEFSLTDDGNGLAFAAYTAGTMAFIPERGWSLYSRLEGRWITDGAESEAVEAARIIARLRAESTAQVPTHLLRATAAWATKSASSNGVSSMLRLAKSDSLLYSPLEKFDRDPDLLNCRGTVVNLRTSETRPARPGDLFTRSTRGRPGARPSPLMDRIILEATRDPATLRAFQAWAGYSATAHVFEEKSAFIPGPAGSGKSTTLESILAALGDYGSQAAPTTFAEDTSGRVRNDLAALVGVRAIGLNELEGDSFLSESTFKTFVSGEALTVRHLFQEFFSYHPVGKITITTNFLPRLRHGGRAIFRRMQIFPFAHAPEKSDPALKKVLISDVDGVLAWILEGASRWYLHGLNPSAQMEAEVNRYASDEDRLGRFLDERCRINTADTVQSGALYSAYRQFVEGEGGRAESMQLFARNLENRGFTRERTMSARLWRGLAIEAI